jgi:hypothetical protein
LVFERGSQPESEWLHDDIVGTRRLTPCVECIARQASNFKQAPYLVVESTANAVT